MSEEAPPPLKKAWRGIGTPSILSRGAFRIIGGHPPPLGVQNHVTHSLTHSLTHLLNYSLTHSLTHALNQLLTHSFTHSALTHSALTHLLTH